MVGIGGMSCCDSCFPGAPAFEPVISCPLLGAPGSVLARPRRLVATKDSAAA
jgi:hypothetical protein